MHPAAQAAAPPAVPPPVAEPPLVPPPVPDVPPPVPEKPPPVPLLPAPEPETQVPKLQVAPSEQLVQAAPLRPQAPVAEPGWHRPERSQHPVEHVEGLQREAVPQDIATTPMDETPNARTRRSRFMRVRVAPPPVVAIRPRHA